MGWWCGGPTVIIDIPTFLCYGTAPGTALAVCFFLYIAMDKFTPGTVSAYMLAILPCCGAVCCFVFVPGAVRGSIRTMVVYGVMVCCALSLSRRCGVFPGGVPACLRSFMVCLPSICSWCVSRRRVPCSRRSLFLYGCSAFLFPAARCPSGAFCCVPVLACLLSYYHSTTLYRRIGSLFVQIPMFPRRS